MSRTSNIIMVPVHVHHTLRNWAIHLHGHAYRYASRSYIQYVYVCIIILILYMCTQKSVHAEYEHVQSVILVVADGAAPWVGRWVIVRESSAQRVYLGAAPATAVQQIVRGAPVLLPQTVEV